LIVLLLDLAAQVLGLLEGGVAVRSIESGLLVLGVHTESIAATAPRRAGLRAQGGKYRSWRTRERASVMWRAVSSTTEITSGIGRRDLHVHDFLHRPAAEAPGELGADLPHLVGGQRRIEGQGAHGEPAGIGDHDRERAIVLERNEADARDRGVLEGRGEQEPG